MSPTSASTASKSSARHVQTSVEDDALTLESSASRRGCRALRRSRPPIRAVGAAVDAPARRSAPAPAVPPDRARTRRGPPRADRDGRRASRLLRQDHGAVGEHRARVGASALRQRVVTHDGDLRLTGRLEPADGAVGWHAGTCAAARATSSSVTAAIALPRAVKSVHAGDRLEVAELVRDVGDAVVVEHEPRPQLVPCAFAARRP